LGYEPRVREAFQPGIIRYTERFQTADGWVQQAVIVCPECMEKPTPKCINCDGTGKPPRLKNAVLDAARSECDASDEDPVLILQRRGLI
jgi:hypothetical protein